jgi:hypothetical protein
MEHTRVFTFGDDFSSPKLICSCSRGKIEKIANKIKKSEIFVQ